MLKNLVHVGVEVLPKQNIVLWRRYIISDYKTLNCIGKAYGAILLVFFSRFLLKPFRLNFQNSTLAAAAIEGNLYNGWFIVKKKDFTNTIA